MGWVEDAYYLRLPSGSPMQGDIWSNLPFRTLILRSAQEFS